MTRSVDGATAVNMGTFSIATPVSLQELSSNDLVRVTGTIGHDMFRVGSSGMFVNKGQFIINGPASLTLVGAAGNDTYQFDADSALGTIRLDEAGGGVDTIDFGPTTSLAVNLNPGNPQPPAVNIRLTLHLGSESTFENAYGGSNNDSLTGNNLINILRGNNGHDIVVGGGGNDQLFGGAGLDLLIGGLGKDIIKGEGGDDILIAGQTTSDTNRSKLFDLRTEWASGKVYATRVTNLRAGVGTTGVSLKKQINVLNDSTADDVLTGGGVATGDGTDWYFSALDDVLADRAGNELLDAL